MNSVFQLGNCSGRPWLHIFSTFSAGGAQVRAIKLLNAGARDQQHLIVSVVSDQVGASELIDPTVKAAIVPFPDLKSGTLLKRLFAIRARVHELKPDLILTYNWGAMEVVLANRLFRMAPLVHHEDGFGPDEAVKQLPRRVWFRRVALGGASNVIVPSRTLETAALGAWLQPRSRVLRIPNGVDVKLFDQPVSPLALPGLDRADGVLQVGTVAGLRPEKNIKRLVRVFAKASQGLNARLVIVGQGPERDAILEEARTEGVSGRVHLTGFLPDPHRYMGLFDVFALTSDTEQFPISLVEAMAAGLACVCTRVGDIADILPPENLVFVHDAGDEASLATSLREALVNVEVRQRVGLANRTKVKASFTSDRMISNYGLAYQSALT